MYFKTETIVGAFIVLALTVFAYMTFQLGSVRLNLARYSPYLVSFKDVSGLAPKADIKIAGVKVGWVDSVHLDPKDMRVKVGIKVLKDYHLYTDASATVRQEGLLGGKFLELIPRIQETGRIEPGGELPYQESPAVGIDQIFEGVSSLTKQIEKLGTSLEESTNDARELLHSVKDRLKNIDKVFSDLGLASERFQETADVVKKAGTQVTELLEFSEDEEPATQQTRSTSQGTLIKLLTDDELYQDIKCTSEYARSCIEGVSNICVGVDSHLEVLPNSFRDKFSHDKRTNVKWYFNTYLGSRSGVFGKLGLTFSNQGYAKHKGDKCFDSRHGFVRGHRNDIRLNLQVGKYWHPYLALRVGIFEGSAGVGLDWWLAYSRFRWLSTFEAFDFRGYNRFDKDRRPHLKWLNRLFFNDNVYLTFGADDFISRCNKSGFVGIGAYFSLPSLFNRCC